MRKQISRTMYALFAVLIIAGISFSSCKKDSTTPVVKTALSDSLTAAKTLLSAAQEGVAEGQYQKGAKATLQTTITAVQAIYDNTASTQIEIDNAKANLSAAVALFKTKTIVPIAQSNLIAQWLFSEGTGTTVTDVSSSHLVGTLMAGHTAIVGRGAIPTWTTDRYGVANQALNFQHGGHIEVPYQSILTPAEITISLWVNVDTIFADNYIISEKWWGGYKFQLQSVNKPFFTFFNGTRAWDNDWNVAGIQNDHKWHQIAVTLKSGELDFYGDGAFIYSWTDPTRVGGTISFTNPQTFVIGQAQPNTLTGIAPVDDPSQWGVGYFKGSLDDIRIYNKALTGTQIQSIYDLEKVTSK